MRKFYLTRVVVDVISEDRPISEDMTLVEIRRFMDEDGVGSIDFKKPLLLTPKQTAHMLVGHFASDPEFFNLDHDGNDLTVKQVPDGH